MKRCVKPPIGEMVRLHQAFEKEDVCLYCCKPMKEWKPMEKCQARYEKRVNNL